jgi:hypothetical protein
MLRPREQILGCSNVFQVHMYSLVFFNVSLSSVCVCVCVCVCFAALGLELRVFTLSHSNSPFL